jgi:acetylornithine/succinyldiaminopimelate/putrescine aminotransferase
MFVKGSGVYLWDVENRRYLDFTAGIAVNALGHCDPEMSKLIAQQVRRKISLTPPPNPTNTHFQPKGQDSNPHLESLP